MTATQPCAQTSPKRAEAELAAVQASRTPMLLQAIWSSFLNNEKRQCWAGCPLLVFWTIRSWDTSESRSRDLVSIACWYRSNRCGRRWPTQYQCKLHLAKARQAVAESLSLTMASWIFCGQTTSWARLHHSLLSWVTHQTTPRRASRRKHTRLLQMLT